MRIESLVVYFQMRARGDLILRCGKVLAVKPRRGLSERVQKANVFTPDIRAAREGNLNHAVGSDTGRVSGHASGVAHLAGVAEMVITPNDQSVSRLLACVNAKSVSQVGGIICLASELGSIEATRPHFDIALYVPNFVVEAEGIVVLGSHH